MTRSELIDKIAQAIAEHEGFFVTEAQAANRRIKFPTRPQANANPGNIRNWTNKRKPYPTSGGYVNFIEWARNQVQKDAAEVPFDIIKQAALDEGWRVLRVLVGQYIDGLYTKGKPPTALEMFKEYAPAIDGGNDPKVYAATVGEKVGARPGQRLIDLITEREPQ